MTANITTTSTTTAAALTHEPVPRIGALVLKLMQKTLEGIAIHRCLVGEKRTFFDNVQFAFASMLEASAEAIIGEYDHLATLIQEMPAIESLSPEQRYISNDKCWKTFTLRTYDGSVSPLAEELCPKTMAALAQIPNVRVAFFSILEPGKKLPPHRGPYKGILRCHLGIKIPSQKEKCRIRVDNEWRHWERGEVMIFDDSFEHEVFNDTTERRVILFIDFVRPLAAPFDKINNFILSSFLDKAEFSRTFTEKQRAWEASVRAVIAAASTSTSEIQRAAAE